MLDAELARLYDMPTKRLNEQVKRNRERFPEEFMFQLTAEELGNLRSQIATSNSPRGGRRSFPVLRLHRARDDHGGDCPEPAEGHRAGEALKYSTFVIPAKAGIQENRRTGPRLSPG